MAVERELALVFFVLACWGSARAAAVGRLRVSPHLEPDSHDDFFGKDLPDDGRPREAHHFDHPFPAVQDTSDYDRDYVRDDNHDGGEWNAQQHYDELRAQIDKQRANVEIARQAEQAEREALEHAEKLNGDASGAAAAAAERARLAREAEANATRKLAAMEAGGAGGDGSVSLKNATEGVSDANMTLEECRRQLEEAKNRVRNLRNAFEADATRANKNLAEKSEAVEGAKRDLEVGASQNAAALRDAEARYADLDKKWKELNRRAQQAEDEHQQALAASRAANATLAKAEAQLHEATERLRAVRYRQANPGGGIHRSGAPARAACVAAVLALASALAASA